MTISVKKRILDNYYAILNRSTGSGHWPKESLIKTNTEKLNTVTCQVTAI